MNQEKDVQEAALRKLEERLDRLGLEMEKLGIAEYVEMLHRPRRLILPNLLAGLARGVGTAVGFILLGALTLYILKQMVLLNLPVIGGFIADIVRIVQQRMQIP